MSEMPGDFGNRVTRTGICDRVRSVLKFVPGFSQKTDNILKQLNKLTDENLSRNQCSRLSGLARVIEDKPDRHTLSMKLDDVSNKSDQPAPVFVMQQFKKRAFESNLFV